MDNELEMPQTFLPIERRPRQDWPWCKGFIVKGVLYSSQATGEDREEYRDTCDLSRGAQRGRAPMA